MGALPNISTGSASTTPPAEYIKINLTRGHFALVDAADYPALSQYKWHTARRGHTSYAATRVKGKYTLMHVMILGRKPGVVTDHINRNGLDNRRSNLRFASPSKNMSNRRLPDSNKTGYRGVHAHANGSFVAEIRANRKYQYLGLFPTPELAAMAYDAKAREIVGSFALLNFPNINAPTTHKKQNSISTNFASGICLAAEIRGQEKAGEPNSLSPFNEFSGGAA